MLRRHSQPPALRSHQLQSQRPFLLATQGFFSSLLQTPPFYVLHVLNVHPYCVSSVAFPARVFLSCAFLLRCTATPAKLLPGFLLGYCQYLKIETDKTARSVRADEESSRPCMYTIHEVCMKCCKPNATEDQKQGARWHSGTENSGAVAAGVLK